MENEGVCLLMTLGLRAEIGFAAALRFVCEMEARSQ